MIILQWGFGGNAIGILQGVARRVRKITFPPTKLTIANKDND